MPDAVEKEIIVKGSRPKPNVELASGGGHGNFAAFVPKFISFAEWQHGIGGGASPVRVRMFSDGQNVVFEFEEIDIKIKIPLTEWNGMSEQQRRVITYIFQHYEKSDRLEAALQHYASEGVSEIIIRFDTQGHLIDGSTYTFQTYPNGSTTAAIVDSRWEQGDTTQTNLKPGVPIIISINSANPAANIMEAFARALIHELLHPWVPNLLQPDGSYDDHDRLYGPNYNDGYVDEEYRDIFKVAPTNLSPGAEVGVAYLGSWGSDSDVGGMGNDIMAGMEGNDILNGLGGSDVLAGGPGMDTLIAGLGFSDLRGGSDADTYVSSEEGANFYLEDTGGVDRLVVAGSSSQLIVARNGNNLSIWSSGYSYAYEIVDHMST